MVTSLFVLSLALTTWHTLCFRFPIAFRSPQPIRLLKGSERTWFERHIPVPDVVRQPLIYLPGLDGGVSNYSEAQFDALSTKYDCWKLRIRPDDRSTFNDLTNLIEEHILSLPTPPIVLGESFGAVLALYVSGKLPYSRIKQLVLVNPATSLDRTNWSQLVPMIARTGRSYPYVGAGTLLATGIQLEQVLERVASVQKRITNFSDLSRELKEMQTVFEKVSDFFPADTLEWRRKHWLEVGSYLLVSGDVYYRVRAPVLLLMGGSDRLLPSSTEGARLKKLLTRTEVTVVDFRDKGHALLDGSIDVAHYINRTLAATARTELGDPFDIELPSAAAVQRLQPVVDILTRTTSPVFLHRNGTGQLCAGLGGVPTGLLGRPVLFVGNHQAFGTLPIGQCHMSTQI
jgi:pimeloyl-ACP methyl ester carboxylesterase